MPLIHVLYPGIHQTSRVSRINNLLDAELVCNTNGILQINIFCLELLIDLLPVVARSLQVCNMVDLDATVQWDGAGFETWPVFAR